MRKNENTFNCKNQSHSQSHVGSFAETLKSVGVQIDIDSFSESDAAQAWELCLIIAEMYILSDETPVQIAGAKLYAGIVKEIYKQLDYEHILLVLINFSKATYEIKHKKTYLRTALYNVIFELEAHYTNQVKTNFGH